jgi:hypothetical protein
MPESVYSADLDHPRVPRSRPHRREQHRDPTTPRRARGSDTPRHERPRPHRRRRRRSPSPSPSSCSTTPTTTSSKDLAAHHKSEADAAATHKQQQVVRIRRDSVSKEAADADESGPEEYTIYPEGYRHRQRDRGYRHRHGDGEGDEYGRYQGRGARYGEGGWYQGSRGRGRDGEKRRRRSRDEAKGFLLAAVVFVAGVILCWD